MGGKVPQEIAARVGEVYNNIPADPTDITIPLKPDTAWVVTADWTIWASAVNRLSKSPVVVSGLSK